MASPIQELWLIVSLPQKESFKVSSIRTAIAARFQRWEGQSEAVKSNFSDKQATGWGSTFELKFPTFELTLLKLFLFFFFFVDIKLEHFWDLATTRQVLELSLVLA